MAERPATNRDSEYDLDRSNALSDGVFAIALTLLVLQIDLPEEVGGDVWGAVRDALPGIQAYAVTFAVIALMWLRHHRFFGALRGIDGTLVVLNLAYLGVVAFMPFPSDLLGDEGDEPASAILFALTLTVVVVFAGLMRVHAERADLLRPGARVPPSRAYLLWPVVFLISIPLALVHPVIAEIVWLLVLGFGATRRVMSRS